MTAARFIQKWSRADLSERAASQEHFIDLCRLLGQPTPAEHDATGAEYAFEKGVAVTGPASAGAKGAGGDGDAFFEGVLGAGGVVLGGGGLAQQPAEVEEMLLAGGPLGQRRPRPLRDEAGGGHLPAG